MSVTISNGRTWQWFWALLFAVAAITVVWLYLRPLPEQTQYIDRIVTRVVPIQKIQYEVKTDTILKLRIIKNTTAEYFLEKRMHEIDSLKALIREYAKNGDTIETIAVADTVICSDQESVKLCDTLRIEYLNISDKFRIALALAPRPVSVRERLITLPEPRGLFGVPVRTMENAGWFAGGTAIGIIVMLIAQTSQQ